MHFGVLGPLTVRDGSTELVLAGTKQRQLLAELLVHRNEPLGAEQLAGSASDAPLCPAAHSALQVRVHRLRSALGPTGRQILLTHGHAYTLHVARDECDADTFGQLVHEAEGASDGDLARRSQLYHAALDLWRGPALHDLSLSHSGQVRVAHLDTLRDRTRSACIDADLRLGRHEDIVDDIRVLADEQPFWEQTRGQLMLALYRCGRQCEALNIYAETRKLLADELGIQPGPGLRDLHTAILEQRPALSWTRPDLARRGLALEV